MLTDETKEEILQILKEKPHLDVWDNDRLKPAAEYLETKGLLKKIRQNIYKLSKEGFDAVELGGFKAWDEDRKRNKNLQSSHLKTSIFQMKISIWIMILSTIISFISGILMSNIFIEFFKTN